MRPDLQAAEEGNAGCVRDLLLASGRCGVKSVQGPSARPAQRLARLGRVNSNHWWGCAALTLGKRPIVYVLFPCSRPQRLGRGQTTAVYFLGCMWGLTTLTTSFLESLAVIPTRAGPQRILAPIAAFPPIAARLVVLLSPDFQARAQITTRLQFPMDESL